jgi:Methyltransferase domain
MPLELKLKRPIMKPISSSAVFFVAVGLVILIHISTMSRLPQVIPSPHLPTHGPPSTNATANTNEGALYASSLSTLRCLATPNCFPSSKCRTGIPKKIKRANRHEEHAFCVSDVQQKKDCLIYSFGIHNSWEWEEKVARLLHCEVHAFDPTMNHPTNLAPGVTFHKLGLQAEGTNMSATHAAGYDAIDPKLLLTLGQIMKLLGHVGRTLDVLALDCEGCEYGALRQMACSGESALVDQLFVEFHFQVNIGLANSDDVILAAQGIDCLWENRWHVVSIEKSEVYIFDWAYAKDVAQVVHDRGFLLFVSFQRIPPNELRPSDYLEQSAFFARKHAETPQDDKAALEKVELDGGKVDEAREKISRPSTVQFDTVEDYVEE